MRDNGSKFRESTFGQLATRWFSAIWHFLQKIWHGYTWPLRRFGAWLESKPRWQAFAENRPGLSRGLGWALVAMLFGLQFLLTLVLAVWIGLFGSLPSGDELRSIETAQTTEIYSADSVLIGKFFIENRTTIKLKDISQHVINALIATEDRRFFEHSGIDFSSWARVVKGLVTGQGGMGGGSTLSQQLAKNLYPRRDYKIPGFSLLINKIRENFTSIRLEQIYEKEDLLNLYLNTVPFGSDRFGISVASKQFFNKKAKDLTPGEAATLVGMLKASTYYDPFRNPKNAAERRNLVLRQMVKNGHLTEQEFAEISKRPVGARKPAREGSNDGVATYFREHLRSEVLPELLKNIKKEDGTPYDIYRDGLKIYTTLHSKMQEFGEAAVQEHMGVLQKQFGDSFKNLKKEKAWGDDKWIDQQIRNSDRWNALKTSGLAEADILQNFEKPVKMTVFSWKGGGTEVDTVMTPLDSTRYYFTLLNCGFMCMDHRNGYVRAWVGGINFKYFKYDHVNSTRQVGSTFKPIVYAAAIQDSVKPCDYYKNEITKIEDWEPHNADERYGGWYSVAGALKNSINVVAAQLIQKVGIEKTLRLARKMGVTSKLPREFGISLGAADISLYEMTQVYGTIANKGIRPDPVLVTRITTRKGAVLYDLKDAEAAAPTHRDTALNEWQAGVVRHMMQGVLDSGGTGARFRRYTWAGSFAGKTGTTQNQSDGWFICFNPQLVTGAWVGGNSPAVRFRSMYLGQGSASALPIVGLFWNKIATDKKLQKLLVEPFTEPKHDVTYLFGCPSRIWVSPDSLWLLEQDSIGMDTLHPGLFAKVKDQLGKLFGKKKTADEGENSESIPPPGVLDKKVPPAEKPPGQKPEKRNFFEKLLGTGKKEKGDEPKPKN